MKNYFWVAVRYVLVGAVNTAIYTGLLWYLLYTALFPYFITVAISYSIAMSFHYLANKYFTFRKTKKSWLEISKYLIASLISYVISVFLVWFFLDVVKLTEFFTVILCGIFALAIGYVFANFWVFKNE